MFRAISEYVWLTTEQVNKLLALHEESLYRRELYVAAMGRITDYQNYDFVKTTLDSKDSETMKALYKRVGILNLFNPSHPDGSYLFNLKLHEERAMFTILGDLDKREGGKAITKVSHNKAAIDNVDQFLKSLPKEGTSAASDLLGVVELTYVCPEGAAKPPVRQTIGEKYLAWNAKIDFNVLTGPTLSAKKS